ncbi:MAG: UDP-N-acetylmuramate--L-alanine ligase, partial [Candidatus Omnitrophica bacterium]|nr:UDP-N-acetylmuramate--L-alanine ligase [Candidatus Omnitrophota bacterium]
MTRSIHFIGIGGIGMSGIAKILIKQGNRVSGSDINAGETTSELSSLGANVFIGHNTS